jgi:hypothetical protein
MNRNSKSNSVKGQTKEHEDSEGNPEPEVRPAEQRLFRVLEIWHWNFHSMSWFRAGGGKMFSCFG